jgi:ABC-type Fe3+-hydroxamate transport system substrate-binding protein
MAGSRDDLGYLVELQRPARRVVSLVPSLTESVAVTRRGALAGATQWCTHPADLDVSRVRGTKNPDLAAIVALQPDIVLANQEENRKLDVERLRAAGVPVWVTVIRSVDEALASLRRMFAEALGWPVPGWLDETARTWAVPPLGDLMGGQAAAVRKRAVICVWRDPWMVVGRDTFTSDLASRLGLDNVFGDQPLVAGSVAGSDVARDAGRYPHVEVADILALRPDVVILPDEPYEFSATDGPESFSDVPVALVSGRDLTWYGPSLVAARRRLTRAIWGA